MKLFARILREGEIQLAREATKDGGGWYELEREPNPQTEYLRYDSDKDIVTIEPRVKTAEEIAAEQKAKEDAELMKADTIRDLQARVAELEKRITAIDKGSTA